MKILNSLRVRAEQITANDVIEVTREEVLEGQRSKLPIGRMARPEEIADVIAFLCSERASIVLGAAWSVDGGAVPGII